MIGSWVKSWFSGVGTFFKEVAQTALGLFIDEMKDYAIEAVERVEERGKYLTGREKFVIAKDMLIEDFPDAGDLALDTAVQLAVAWMEEHLK